MLMEFVRDLIIIILVMGTLWLIVASACGYALGAMHTWLKERAEVFGDNEGLRDELADIRGRLNEE